MLSFNREGCLSQENLQFGGNICVQIFLIRQLGESCRIHRMAELIIGDSVGNEIEDFFNDDSLFLFFVNFAIFGLPVMQLAVSLYLFVREFYR